MKTTTDDMIVQDLPEAEEGTLGPGGSRIKRFFRRFWDGPEMTTEQRKTYLWIYQSIGLRSFLTAMALWIVYGALMLALGGRNPAYGTGWERWNYWRWMLAPHDMTPFYDAEPSISDFFILLPASFTATGFSSILLTARVAHGTVRPIRRRLLAGVASCQIMGLVFLMSRWTAFRVWWFTPHTVIPSLTVLAFELTTIVAWFTFPLLLYWLMMPIIWNCETRLARAEEKASHELDGKAVGESRLDQLSSAEVVRDYGGEEEKAKRVESRKRAVHLSVAVFMALCAAVSILYLWTPAPALPAATGTWTKLPLDYNRVFAIAIDRLPPSTMYISADKGIFRSTDGGSTWTQQSMELTSETVIDLDVDSHTPSSVYAVTSDRGVLHSRDGGRAWAATGVISQDVQSLAVDPVTPSVLYAGTEDGGIFRSADAGATWTAVNIGLADRHGNFYSIRDVVFDPHNHSSLYAGTYSRGVFRSTDSGNTWTPVDSGLMDVDINSLVIDPLTPTTMYVGADYGEGVLRSADGGRTWMPMNAGLTNMNIEALAIDPGDPSILYVGTYGGIFRYSANPSVK